jgi:hypothetical protein
MTMTNRFSACLGPLQGWRFAREDIMENVGTIMNWAQKGGVDRYQAMLAGL